MQRDMDLVRRILEQVDARTDRRAIPIVIDGVDPVVLGKHVEMLAEVGLIKAVDAGSMDEPEYNAYLVSDLTWQGHDFLGDVYNENVWPKLKAMLSPEQMARMSLKLIQETGFAVAKAWVTGKLGL